MLNSNSLPINMTDMPNFQSIFASYLEDIRYVFLATICSTNLNVFFYVCVCSLFSFPTRVRFFFVFLVVWAMTHCSHQRVWKCGEKRVSEEFAICPSLPTLFLSSFFFLRASPFDQCTLLKHLFPMRDIFSIDRDRNRETDRNRQKQTERARDGRGSNIGPGVWRASNHEVFSSTGLALPTLLASLYLLAHSYSLAAAADLDPNEKTFRGIQRGIQPSSITTNGV